MTSFFLTTAVPTANATTTPAAAILLMLMKSYHIIYTHVWGGGVYEMND